MNILYFGGSSEEVVAKLWLSNFRIKHSSLHHAAFLVKGVGCWESVDVLCLVLSKCLELVLSYTIGSLSL